MKMVVIGAWKIGDPVGRGQSGTVYEVTETIAPFRHGALKIHHGPRVKVSRAEFLRESHFVENQPIPDYMPDFYDSGELEDGTPWFVMEFAEKLSERLSRREIVAVIDRIAEALERLDDRKFYHGDIKPRNIGLIDGKAVLLDFGSICAHTEAASASIRLGTPYYMAPELENGGAVSVLTDLFSLGITLKELRDVADERVFDPLVHHTTALDPKARPQSVQEFRHELQDALPSFQRAAARENRLDKFKTITRRVGLVVGVIAVVYGILASINYHRRQTLLNKQHKRLIEAMAIERTANITY